MNIFKKLYINLRGKRAKRILNKAETLPKNSMKLYKDLKKAGLNK